MAAVARGSQPWVWEELDPPGGSPAAGVEPPGSDGSDLDGLVEASYREGFEEGIREGARRAEAELDPALASLSDVLARVEEARRAMVVDLEENAVALALAVARELVVSELDRAPETVAELVREAVSAFALDAPLTVRLNPADLALITVRGDTAVSGARDVRWEPDPAVGRGGCLIEGPGKIVDGRLDLALERIYQAIAND